MCQDHMRKAGDVCFAEVSRDSEGMTKSYMLKDISNRVLLLVNFKQYSRILESWWKNCMNATLISKEIKIRKFAKNLSATKVPGFYQGRKKDN